MEEKERFEVMSPSLNGYAYIHDLKTDNVLNTYDSCDLLNQQSKRIKELEKENRDLEDDHNKLIDQYDKQYNDLCKEIQFNSSVRERFVKKVKELKQQLAITEDFKLHQLCDWEWLGDENENVLKQVVGKPAYKATLVKYADYICEKPYKQIKIVLGESNVKD